MVSPLHRSLAAAVSSAGVAVVHARAVRSTDVGRYVHKVNADAVVRPYTDCLSLGSLAGQTVTLKFTGTEDSSLQTSFVVDDTAVNTS